MAYFGEQVLGLLKDIKIVLLTIICAVVIFYIGKRLWSRRRSARA
jgi:uncharacterized membrane protein